MVEHSLTQTAKNERILQHLLELGQQYCEFWYIVCVNHADSIGVNINIWWPSLAHQMYACQTTVWQAYICHMYRCSSPVQPYTLLFHSTYLVRVPKLAGAQLENLVNRSLAKA